MGTASVKIGSEIAEEELQNFIEPLIRTLVFNEEYDAPTVEELAYTALLTFVTTGVLEGGDIVSAGKNPAQTNGQNNTASTKEAGQYRAELPQNVELPTVPIINLSMQDVADLNGGTMPRAGNYVRDSAYHDTVQRLGLDRNGAAYIEAVNVTRNGDAYVLKLTKPTIKKMLSADSYEGKVVPLESVAVIKQIERVAQNGVWYDSKGDRQNRPQIAGYDYLKTTVYIDGEPYIVNMRVRVEDQMAGGENRLYHFTPEAVEVIKKDDGTIPSTGRHATSIKSGGSPSSATIIPQTSQEINGPSQADIDSIVQQLTEEQHRSQEAAIEQMAAELRGVRKEEIDPFLLGFNDSLGKAGVGVSPETENAANDPFLVGFNGGNWKAPGDGATKVGEQTLENGNKGDTIKTGAVNGAYNDKNDPEGKARDAHAERYYTSIYNSKKENIVAAISKNAGIDSEYVSKMYDHLFVNEYNLDKGHTRFDPDYYIAESIQRLRDGKNIQTHDLTLVYHEAMEYDLMNDKGLSYEEAHEIANKFFNYKEKLDKWIDENES